MPYTWQEARQGGRMTAAIVVLMCWATMIVAGTTPIGRLLKRLLVEYPATALNRLEPGHIALAIVVTMLIVIHLNAGEADPTRMIALIAPDIALWLASIEIGVIVETVIAVAAAVGMLRRAGIAAILTAMSNRWRRDRKVASNSARKSARCNRRAPANDDEDGEFALAS